MKIAKLSILIPMSIGIGFLPFSSTIFSGKLTLPLRTHHFAFERSRSISPNWEMIRAVTLKMYDFVHSSMQVALDELLGSLMVGLQNVHTLRFGNRVGNSA